MNSDLMQHFDSARVDSPYALLCRYADIYVDEDHEPLSGQEYSAINYLGFGVGAQNLLVRVRDVRSVLNELPYLTRLPFSPPWLAGLSSVRGEIVTVVAFSQIVDVRANKLASGVRAHYILLGGSGTGFLLKVDRLFGISRQGIEDALKPPQGDHKSFIDARGMFEGKDWQRIDLDVLVDSALHD